MQKRVHSREFKLEIVRQIATGQKRPAQVCREYGLAESVLSRWRKDYQERGEAAFEALQAEGPTSQEQRIRELEQFCGQLALQNQVLKKTLQRLESRSVTRSSPGHIKNILSSRFCTYVSCMGSAGDGTMSRAIIVSRMGRTRRYAIRLNALFWNFP